MSAARFDLPGLHAAVETERAGQGLSRAALGKRIGVAPSTIARAASAPDLEADGVLAIIGWLGVAPECFVVPAATNRDALLPVTAGCMVRAGTASMYLLLDRRRIERGLTWGELCDEVGAPVTSSGLRLLRRGGRTGIAALTGVAAWLDVPIAELTRVSEW